MKSGDIQIFTSTIAEAIQLKDSTGWLRGLGEHAELIIPTYGVIVHGISTSSINIKDQEATIQQILADNYTVVPNAKVSYIGWLTKEATLKRASSIVVEFTDPEAANAIIYAGMAWDGHIHQCQLYDRACRIKQCFRCYNYGHIGTQCNASQVCGCCAEQHETKHCTQKGVEGFTPRCAVCKGVHTAWSNACPARKKEMERVGQAKLTRSTYWHVPLKESTIRPRKQDLRQVNARQEDRALEVPVPAEMTTHRPREAARPTASRINTLMSTGTREPLLGSQPIDHATEQILGQAPVQIGNQVLIKEPTIQPPAIASDEQDWEPTALRQQADQQTVIPLDLSLKAIEEPFAFAQAIETGQL